MAGGSSGRFAEMMRVIVQSERLDELPEPPLDPNRVSFFSRLLKSECLPYDECPEPQGGRTPFIARLFSRETLPFDPAPTPGRTGRKPRH